MVSQTQDNYNATQNNTNLTPGDPLEKDFSSGRDYSSGGKDFSNGGYHLDHNVDSDQALHRIRTAGSISISPELFEKLYLSPQNQVKGDLRKTFGNPTPLALTGFLLCLTPLSCQLMGWRGASGNGAATVASYFFMGGLLMLLGAIGEFLLGNTFPFVVFGSFAGFWLSFAGTLVPFYNAYGAFATPGEPLTSGLEAEGFNASFGFFQLFMGVLCTIYFVCSLRTNIVFAVIFLTLIPAFSCLAGAYFQLANGNAELAGKLLVVAGALTFITDLAGWWIFAAIMLASLDFPFQIPVGDLSRFIKGASEKQRMKDEEYAQ